METILDTPVSVSDMLRARDDRVERQARCLQKNKAPLVCLSMNIAGPIKATPLIARGFDEAVRMIEACLQNAIRDREITRARTGFEALWAVAADARALKRRMCALEETEPFGRVLDIDVLDARGAKISREDIGRAPRACLLCERGAFDCARSRRHPVEALFANVESRIRAQLNARFSELVESAANRALTCEVSVTPKPGLVDRANAGAHRDMDFFTFLDSIAALAPYFRHCALTGIRFADAPSRLMDALRPLGMIAEADMARATHGVNTHRGAIFSLGILAAAAGVCFQRMLPMNSENVCARAGEIARETIGELPEAHSAGGRAYRAHGLRGARGEAAGGFITVREAALPELRARLQSGMCLNDAGVMTLLRIMTVSEDTNIVSRASFKRLQDLRARACALLRGTPAMADIERLDAELIRDGLSPGGSADLLSVAFFLYFLEETIWVTPHK